MNNKWDDIEFINEGWYWTYWSAQNATWSVSQNDHILFPGNYALRTKSEPYISVEDQSRLNLDETFSSDTTHEEGSSLLHKEGVSPEDQPMTDWQEAIAVKQTADILEELELAKTPKNNQQMSATYATQATTAYIQSSNIGTSPLTVMGGAAPTGQGQVPMGGTGQGASQGMLGMGQIPGTSGQGAGGTGGQGSLGSSQPTGMGGQPPSGGGGGGPPSGGGGSGLPGAPAPEGPPAGPPPPPGQNLPPGQAGPIPAANGALKGHAPEIFDGNRQKTTKFVREFDLWRMCNINAEVMTNPFQRVAVALSYIKGSCVDDWVAQEAKKMVDRVYGQPHNNPPIPPTHRADDEVLWNDFITDFESAYADTASEEQAYTDMMKLEIKGDEINKYIAAFEYLLIRAGWERDARGLLEMFKQGLRKGLHWTILQCNPMPVTLNDWQAAARREVQRRCLVFASLGPRGGDFLSTRQNRQRDPPRRPQGRQPQRDPNAMDVDVVSFGGKEESGGG